MKTRTRLTTPPGEDPAPPPSASASSTSDAAGEHYVPGFALPHEPRVPGRYRKLLIVAAVLVALAVLGYAILQVVTAGEDFDPAVDQNVGDPATQEPAGDGEG